MPKKLDLEREQKPVNNSNLVPGTSKDAKTSQKRAFFDVSSKPGVKPGVVQNKLIRYRKRFMDIHLPYKLPTICRCQSGEWYIQYYYEYPDKPGKFKPFKVKDGINRIHDKKLKEAAARQLVIDLTYWLEVLNYNPFEEKLDAIRQAAELIAKHEAPKNWTLAEAIVEFRAFIKKQGRAQRTVQTYNNYLYNLEGYIKEFPDKNIEARKFTEYELVEFLDTECNELEWSGRTYNNYLDFYNTFFNRCLKLEKKVHRNVTYDFDISGIDYKTSNPQKNKAYTPVLQKAIKHELLNARYQNLRDYIEWIYLSAMRPDEIRSLKISDIDEVNRQIRIIGKTGDRLIPISDQLLKLIKRRGLMTAGFNKYVFGYAGTISFDRMGREFFTAQYTEIKRKLHLDYNHTLYGWKHTGILAMIKAGFSDDQIRTLTGHKTVEAFRAYKRDLVIENDHAMKGSTIEF